MARRCVSAGPAQPTRFAIFYLFRGRYQIYARPGVRGGLRIRPTLEEVFMNNRLLIALPLAAVLALPALAQTTDSSTTPAAAPSAENATGKAPLAPPSREGFWGRVNPFARKSYVKRQTEPIRDRVNELDELTSQNGKNIKDTDSRAQAGIKLASDKADAADQHAVDAGNK